MLLLKGKFLFIKFNHYAKNMKHFRAVRSIN